MKSRAFTLLELIIVLSLLAILSSYAVSKFVDIAHKSLDIQERATIAGIRTAVLLYKAQYRVWPDGDSNLWSPFELTDNAPPHQQFSGSGDYQNGVYWFYGIWALAGGRHCWQICCPHASLVPVDGKYVGRCWSYMIDSGPDNWGTEIHSAGSLVEIVSFVGH